MSRTRLISSTVVHTKMFSFLPLIPPQFIYLIFFSYKVEYPELNSFAFIAMNNLMILIAIGFIILIILLYLFSTKKIKSHSKELEKELEEKKVKIYVQEKEILLQTEKLTKQINLSEQQNKVIHKQTVELKKHRHHLEKIVESRTNDLKFAKEKAEESDQLKTSFLENMSHEIRTPMNAIMGFAALLNDTKLSETNKRKYISRINNNCQVLLSLIDNILDMSKIHAGQMQIFKSNFSIKNALLELYDYYYREKEELGLKNITLNLKIGPDDKDYILYSDSFRFNQIMSSLIGNALKYTEKGSINFGCIPHYNTEYEKEPHMLQFFVEDTGIGIHSDKSEFIFDRFSKIEDDNSKLYRGAGLGLYIAKHLVTLMGGKIWVHSRFSEGSIFNFTLPYFDTGDVKPKKTTKGKSTKKSFPSYDWRNKTILIVEDEQNNFIYLSEIIKRTGAKVLEANNGQQSYELIQKNPEINLVLMDLMMPEMNGYEATRKIKALRPSLPIIAQTAYTMAKEKKKSLESGCDGYISKPYNPPVLLDLIHNFL